MPFKASAPGSLMLLGEHAVLHGKPALVGALDKRITVTLTPMRHDRIEIISNQRFDNPQHRRGKQNLVSRAEIGIPSQEFRLDFIEGDNPGLNLGLLHL